jgi:nicotinamidase-related amidase
MPTRSYFPKARTALLIVDVINPFDFPGGSSFARKAERAARRIDRLRRRARAARVPVVYVNDNFGRWRSNADALIAWCGAPGMNGARIAGILRPAAADFVVLKSTLSGFYQTPLETMLRSGGVRTVIVTGFAADNCVLFTAADAYMRDFRIVMPTDCVAGKTPDASRRALALVRELFDARTSGSSTLRLSR